MLTNILQTTCWEVSITRHLPILSLQKKTCLELGLYTKIYNDFRNSHRDHEIHLPSFEIVTLLFNILIRLYHSIQATICEDLHVWHCYRSVITPNPVHAKINEH